MLLYNNRDPKICAVIEEFLDNGGDFLIDALCRDQDYAVNFFTADKRFKKRNWTADIARKEKVISLNSNIKSPRNSIIALAKALAHQSAFQENQTGVYDPKFKHNLHQGYRDKMRKFSLNTKTFTVFQKDIEDTPMVGGLKSDNCNKARWKSSIKKIKTFSGLTVE